MKRDLCKLMLGIVYIVILVGLAAGLAWLLNQTYVEAAVAVLLGNAANRFVEQVMP